MNLRQTISILCSAKKSLLSVAITLCCLSLFFSCETPQKDEPYADIDSASFTFDEYDSSKNVVSVLSNTSWSVYWKPTSEGVEVAPTSGVNNGSFRIVNMPYGTSIRFGVTTGGGINSARTVIVKREAFSGEVSLTLSPERLEFDTKSENKIEVKTNVAWRATSSDISLKFSPQSGNGSGTITISDIPAGATATITVTAGGGDNTKTSTATITRQGYRWAELPATPANMNNRKIHTYWSKTVKTAQNVRNYTYCYDTYRHCPLWIAHPQHACYQEGGYTRPANDPWEPDPNMTQSEQAIIWKWSDGYDKYVVSDSPLFRWTRGHMLASSYRGCGDKNNPAEINCQTFYASNIAPQGGADFESLWSQAEVRIEDNYVCADTLYCVSGAHFANDSKIAYDGSWVYSNKRYYIEEAKQCIVPTHYYKLILRTRSGSLGKPIQECDASELKAVGFWFENGDGTAGEATSTLGAEHLRSVEWIEKQTGFTFFPDVPASVKEQCNAADWGM